MNRLKDTIFSNKLTIDNRIDDPLFSFNLPILFDKEKTTTTTCHFVTPNLSFYLQFYTLIFIQTIVGAILAIIVYQFIIEPQHKKEKLSSSSVITQNLITFGVVMPILFWEPIYAIDYLGIENVALKFTLSTLPIANSLRTLEALYGNTPPACRKTKFHFLIYYSSPSVEVAFDDESPRPISYSFIHRQLMTLGRDIIIVSVLISLLAPYRYVPFSNQNDMFASSSSLQDVLSWKRLVDNFLFALLFSFTLSQGTMGAQILYNILSGYQTHEVVKNPMLKTTSPSDFWGQRWNMFIHRGLKNGVYKPMRKNTSLPTIIAIFTTFLVSGILHEYVNHVLFSTTGDDNVKRVGMQLYFFGWNGILVILERCWSSSSLGGKGSKLAEMLPRSVRTMLVLLMALPVAHWFSRDWIVAGFFDNIGFANFKVFCGDYVMEGR